MDSKEAGEKHIKDTYFCSCIVRSVGCAGEIYTDMMITTLIPLIYEGFQSAYAKASDYERRYEEVSKKNKEITNPGIDILFQTFLQGFKKWNSVTIEDETKRIRNGSQCAEYFDDLIRAVVKSQITMLKCTTEHGELVPDKFYETVDINLFIHKCYTESTKLIYNNPKLFYGESEFQKNDIENASQIAYEMRNNKEMVYAHIKAGIKNALREILPMRQVLSEFLNTDLDKLNKEYIENVKNMVMDDLYAQKDRFGENLFGGGEAGNAVEKDDLDFDVNELIYGRRIQETQGEPDRSIQAPNPQSFIPAISQPLQQNSIVEQVSEQKRKDDQRIMDMMRNTKKLDNSALIVNVNPNPTNKKMASEKAASEKAVSEKQVESKVISEKIASEKQKTNSPEKQTDGNINIVRKLKDINANHFSERI